MRQPSAHYQVGGLVSSMRDQVLVSLWVLPRECEIRSVLHHPPLRTVASSAALHGPSMISDRPTSHSSKSPHPTQSSSFILIAAICAYVELGVSERKKLGLYLRLCVRTVVTVGVDQQFRGRVAVGRDWDGRSHVGPSMRLSTPPFPDVRSAYLLVVLLPRS
jgi:hypothetical protein